MASRRAQSASKLRAGAVSHPLHASSCSKNISKFKLINNRKSQVEGIKIPHQGWSRDEVHRSPKREGRRTLIKILKRLEMNSDDKRTESYKRRGRRRQRIFKGICCKEEERRGEERRIMELGRGVRCFSLRLRFVLRLLLGRLLFSLLFIFSSLTQIILWAYIESLSPLNHILYTLGLYQSLGPLTLICPTEFGYTVVCVLVPN